MKKYSLLITIIICSFNFTCFGQINNHIQSSDSPSGFTFDFDKTISLIFERLKTPTTSNNDVKVIVEEKSFPKLNEGQEIDSEYKKKIGLWIESNQNIIISTLKARKDIVQSY